MFILNVTSEWIKLYFLMYVEMGLLKNLSATISVFLRDGSGSEEEKVTSPFPATPAGLKIASASEVKIKQNRKKKQLKG